VISSKIPSKIIGGEVLRNGNLFGPCESDLAGWYYSMILDSINITKIA